MCPYRLCSASDSRYVQVEMPARWALHTELPDKSSNGCLLLLLVGASLPLASVSVCALVVVGVVAGHEDPGAIARLVQVHLGWVVRVAVFVALRGDRLKDRFVALSSAVHVKGDGDLLATVIVGYNVWFCFVSALFRKNNAQAWRQKDTLTALIRSST